jgi:hypothetical protein
VPAPTKLTVPPLIVQTDAGEAPRSTDRPDV